MPAAEPALDANRTRPVAAPCPVCLSPIGDQPACVRCGWTLRSEFVLGDPTDDEERAFQDSLHNAQRSYDLRSAARAAGFPWHGDERLLLRLQRYLRGGSASAAELALARRAAVADRGLAFPDIADEQLLRHKGLAVEISSLGVTATRFDGESSNEVYELAEIVHWSWPELLPNLPTDPDEQRFVLAGGVGRGRPSAATIEETLGRTLVAVTAEAAPFALNCLVSGWPIAERALQLLRARHPAARITMSPDDLGGGSEATRSVALHAGGRITAFSAAGDVNDGQVVVAVGAADGSVRIQAMAASSEPVRRVLHRGRITALDVAAGGAMVISGGQDGAVRIWSPATRGHQRVLASHDGWVNAVQARQGIVFSLGDDGRLRRTSIEARPPAAAESAYPISVGWATSTALAVSEDAGLVAIGGTDGRVLLWDGVTGMPRGDLSVGTAIVALALSPAAKLLAVAGEDGSVHAYELPKHKLLARLLAPTGQPNCLAVGPSSEIATGEDSGRVRLWRTGSRGGLGDQGIVLGRHRDAVGGVAVTGSGQLISASESGLVRAWRGAGAGRRRHEVEAP